MRRAERRGDMVFCTTAVGASEMAGNIQAWSFCCDGNAASSHRQRFLWNDPARGGCAA
jgi:hypothetical protein